MRVSLFITCLADQFYPGIGVATIRLLERLRIRCDVPPGQTCCGQPAFNSGFREEARTVARQFLKSFRDAELIVAPSGSCIAMVRHHLPSLFDQGSAERAAALAIASRAYELSEFLVDVAKSADVGAAFPHRVAYHPSCHLLRELGVREAPPRLLRSVKHLELVELGNAEACCGFGGTFALKYPEISAAMGREKIASLAASGAEYVVANDAGCLMHLGGMLRRAGASIQPIHLAEVLAHHE